MPFLMAGVSVPLARWIYGLGRQVQKAKATGSYQLVEKLGAGGMGEVWRAKHRMLAREVLARCPGA